ncbi:MAG: hypothetical protein GF334_03405 [Candidatus Altiarchaeales archaeon]|nr:hypothetical protein [Candidatus Altiarchaeales archaeon]
MVKFLTGGNYDGSQVPVCAFWSTEATTDKDEDFADIEAGATQGNCIANHYFAVNDISCFNAGQCNGEGKCLPCTKYKYAGMRMGISHSPPMDFFRQFNKGLTEAEIKSPQFRALGSAVQQVDHDQLPFHIIIRNIQAEIAKCCRWSVGDGEPSKFVLAKIIDGPDLIVVTTANGGTQTLRGIRVNNSAFPDSGTPNNPEGGSFFPVGLSVVAGWEDQPSFYLEPRTHLVKNGEGVVFKSSGNNNAALARAKQLAARAPAAAANAQAAINAAGVQATQLLNTEVGLANNILQSNAPASQKDNANARVAEKQAAVDAIADAQSEASSSVSSINSNASATISAEEPDAVISAASDLSLDLDLLAIWVEIASSNAGGQPASETAAAAARVLRSLAQSLLFSGSGGFTKCELAFTDENPAAQWNSPTDGSLPCNGMRSDCKFYTGPRWQFATTEKMEIGKPVLAEAIQEVRFYSDDWSRFSDPEEEFRTRFSVPFIWAFKDYIDAGGTPFIEDMILYKPKTLFARAGTGDNLSTVLNSYETMRVNKVEIRDYTDLDIRRSLSRIQPGQDVLDKDAVPSFATTISQFSVPSAVRLKITHPPTDETFVYRTWSPRFTNRISLFGNASPNQTIYIVNNTALRARDRYHQFFETKNLFDVPSGGLPGANSDFVGTTAAQLIDIFDVLEKEKESNQSEAVLGFDIVSSDTTGFWDSLVEVDLVHNDINDIFAFILINDVDFIFDKVQVDYRVLHSIVTQDSFEGVDFTIHDTGITGVSKLGIATRDQAQEGIVRATARQILGNEPVTVNHGYYAWRFKDRNISKTDGQSDLQSDTGFVVEADPDGFVVNLTYRVVQYRDEEEITNWYRLQDCGIIMAEISSPNAHRVLPLPDQSGQVKALSSVLVNNGSVGSVVAPWAPEKVTLTIEGEEKEMVLLYRNEEGVGLPANYVVLGPAPGAENLFGRPDPARDSLTIRYTYLRAQTHARVDQDPSPPEGSGEIVTEDFYGADLREHNHAINFLSTGLIAGGTRPDQIQRDQQDYCFVFQDSTGRPIGRKVVRFAVMYYNLAAISVEIFYQWRSNCVTYALYPDLFLSLGTNDGTTMSAPGATINPEDLLLGSRVQNLLGNHGCGNIPLCGDHEFLSLGPLRKEFEIIANVAEDTGDEEEPPPPELKAFFPSAGQVVEGEIVISEPPGTQWRLRRGPLWYPYTICERPRYNKSTQGPLNTDTTELINAQTGKSGVATGEFGVGTFTPGEGEFGALPPESEEAYRGPDEVSARALDIHPSLRACTSSYTYGNTVKTGGNEFVGYARKRGEVDPFWYEGLGWSPPPFGNFGRAMLLTEVATKVGDYAPPGPVDKGFRWMPVFPEREELGGTLELFSESPQPESVVWRLVGSQTPLGGTGESAPDGTVRFSHKSLITNRTTGVSYPHVSYFPVFLPDGLIGSEPENQGIAPGTDAPRGTTTTAWAWREADRPITRGADGTDPILGLQVLLPDYFLDNQRMEVRLRPQEGFYQINYTAPQYDSAGEIVENGTLQLGEGPPREIIIDFVNKRFGLANQPDTAYDTNLILGDDPFPCEPRFSSNLAISQQCGCEGQVSEDSDFLPAIFIHADQISPDGFYALYSTNEMGPAFATDLPSGGSSETPKNICNYFLEHIYFRLDSNFLPLTPSFDPAFSNALTMQYTWSRVPHGRLGGSGQDGTFGGQENRAQNYVDKQGVLTTRPFDGQDSLSKNLVSAYFPSPSEAQQALQDSTGILVPGALDVGDPKLLGGAPATNSRSRGQSEPITLDVIFGTFVSVKRVRIWFLAGEGMQVPTVTLSSVSPQNRTGNFPTERSSLELGSTSLVANGGDIPSSQNFDVGDIIQGQVLLQVSINPVFTDIPFWDRFAQEFHLEFAGRENNLSMGIHAIEFEVDALLGTSSLSETVFIPDRKYYTSTFSPVGTNPMDLLKGIQEATAYWRTTSVNADSGANRHRAYAWDTKVDQESNVGQGGGQPIIKGEPEELEQLQEEEYDKARKLMLPPYSFSYTGFVPLDEQRWIDFLGGTVPSWTTRLSLLVSNIDEVSDVSSGNLVYGQVPQRSRWNAPGHAWIHVLEEELYQPCCEGCADSQTVNYEFIHLHDNLKVVETKSFWDELPGGLLKGVRSIMESPDVIILDEGQLLDAQGNPIPQSVLDASGIARDPETGELIIE